MQSPGEQFIPGGFFAITNGWTNLARSTKLPTKEQRRQYMQASGAPRNQQTTKEGRFHEEGYVCVVMCNKLSHQSPFLLLRSICLPSMKGGHYIVHAVIDKRMDAVLGGRPLPLPCRVSVSVQLQTTFLVTEHCGRTVKRNTFD